MKKSIRLRVAVLATALLLSALGSVAHAQGGCSTNCQRTFYFCMQDAAGDPEAEEVCEAQYLACSFGCIDNAQQLAGKAQFVDHGINPISTILGWPLRQNEQRWLAGDFFQLGQPRAFSDKPEKEKGKELPSTDWLLRR